jgi:hypothetical protein
MIKNSFELLKEDLKPNIEKVIFSIKVTLAACIGAGVAVYLNLVAQKNYGWWICSTIFSIPALSIGATVYKIMQRFIATIAGCLLGLLIVPIVTHNPKYLFIAVCLNTFIWSYLKAAYPKQEYTFSLSGILCFIVFNANFLHTSPIELAFLRTIDTLSGFAIVLLIFAIIYPSIHTASKQIDELNQSILYEISKIYSKRVHYYLTGDSEDLDKIKKLNIDIINKIISLNQLIKDKNIEIIYKEKTNYLNLFRHSKKLREKINSLSLLHKKFPKNIFPKKTKLIKKNTKQDEYIKLEMDFSFLLILVNNISSFHSLEKDNILEQIDIKNDFFHLISLTKKLLQPKKTNIQKMKILVLEINEIINNIHIKFDLIISQKEHLTFPLIDNLRAYDFLKHSKEIVNYYEKILSIAI